MTVDYERSDWEHLPRRARKATVLLVLAWLGACDSAGGEVEVAGGDLEVEAGDNLEASMKAHPAAFEQGDEDWDVLRTTALMAYEQGWDSLPMGDLVAKVGQSFLGTPYVAHTLESPGEEHLVIELQGLDCVTFVEHALAIARMVKSVSPAIFEDTLNRYRFLYMGILSRIRYRNGEIDGYPSRLHYFSEWINDNDRLGLLNDLTAQLGGIEDTEPIDFMTTHPDAYRQLQESPEFVGALQTIESELNTIPRSYVPEDKIAGVASQIRTGDIIATTSTVEGLDIAHTGIALWVGDELHLLHAPLRNGVVQISERPLAIRVKEIRGQDGIMVARPLEVR